MTSSQKATHPWEVQRPETPRPDVQRPETPTPQVTSSRMRKWVIGAAWVIGVYTLLQALAVSPLMGFL